MKPLVAAYVLLFALVGGAVGMLWYGGSGENTAFEAIVEIAPTGSGGDGDVARPTPTADAAKQAPPPTLEEGDAAPKRAQTEIPLPDDEEGAASSEAPMMVAAHPELLEEGRDGPLPIIGPGGAKPWQIYAQPFSAPKDRPRIAVVIENLGLSMEMTERAIGELPAVITLAFSPYGKNIVAIGEKARAAGHEILIAIPMEPAESTMDPGPRALRISMKTAELETRFKWLLSRSIGYVGVITDMGSLYTTKAAALRPVLAETRDRGLMFVDGRSTKKSIAARIAKDMRVPLAFADVRIRGELVQATIDAHLLEAEVIARLKGAAVVVVPAHPLVLDRVVRWLPEAKKNGMVLAPITAIADRQKIR